MMEPLLATKNKRSERSQARRELWCDAADGVSGLPGETAGPRRLGHRGEHARWTWRAAESGRQEGPR
ncbi:hypothetical protein NDU88_011999 [Pleurodeles waltl]|uniref:Uncharacterized protein n=1 Tax=Pleurodeles waltl TaxID=8319 RepID=A0AAV7R3D8_PLEWA|nr:hypothetical protein NDU88_011999 [Pleurodeles waltl]